MKQITVDPEIVNNTPNFHIGVLVMNVNVKPNSDMDALIQEYETKINKTYDIKDVVNLDIIKDGRDAYKAYGKDPSRYRLAVESLYRRLVKGNTLYRINNVVDTGNILSLETRKSVAVLDYDKIEGDICIRLGRETDEYHGIGRGRLNIESIPVYEDLIGPFGSTTSDTERTMITSDTTTILVFIISFSGSLDLPKNMSFAKDLYTRYCQAVTLYETII
jgi:DNA/RNA-binding domain of Phe-tRNA-synthetase-like protein